MFYNNMFKQLINLYFERCCISTLAVICFKKYIFNIKVSSIFSKILEEICIIHITNIFEIILEKEKKKKIAMTYKKI